MFDSKVQVFKDNFENINVFESANDYFAWEVVIQHI